MIVPTLQKNVKPVISLIANKQPLGIPVLATQTTAKSFIRFIREE